MALRRLRFVVGPLLAGIAASGLAGCVTGERPRLGQVATVGGETGVPTGNPAVDAVLALLEQTDRPAFTASYEITRKLGPHRTTGVVVQDGQATSITVGDIRFLQGDQASTCSISRRTCEPGTLDARISDYSIGSAFYAAGPARALRVTYSRRSGEPEATQETIASVTASCVRVPVGAGTETYCATPIGPLARWETAAVDIELTGLQDTPDQSAFRSPG